MAGSRLIRGKRARVLLRARPGKLRCCWNHVLDAPVTVLFGRSGLGKTSLLRAGLFPLLRDPSPHLSLTRIHYLPVYVRLDLEAGCGASVTAATSSRPRRDSGRGARRDAAIGRGIALGVSASRRF